MKNTIASFESFFEAFGFKYDLHTVFDDFLTMALCAVTRNPATGISHYEDLYLQTVERYKTDELRFLFPKMFSVLVEEMEALKDQCNDVLGAFYEQHLYKKGAQQFFTPWPICEFMAKSTLEYAAEEERKAKRILEPACGSGRMLLAAAKVYGRDHYYYGVDIDPTCVKMTALNLFLNGIFGGEVLCGNFLLPDDFTVSYKVSLFPLGIFRIENKEESPLWQSLKMKPIAKFESENLRLPSEEGNQEAYLQQLKLF
jgi:hypothetical protein